MNANEYQRRIKAQLEKHFGDVRTEWSVAKDASDRMARDRVLYAPRVDIAVGPFSSSPGALETLTPNLLPETFQAKFGGLQPNANPRCLLAIEVVFSGSSKHIMGDMLNASALGLYGVVVGKSELMPKIERIRSYLNLLADLEKQPRLFRNLVVMDVHDLNSLAE